MKAFKTAAAQGEVNINVSAAFNGVLPDAVEAGLKPVAVEDGLLIVGHSESGHHHGFRPGPGVTVLERTKDVPAGMKIFYAILENPTALIQDAASPHDGLLCEARVHECRVSREFDPFSEQVRRVQD